MAKASSPEGGLLQQ